MVKIDSPNGLIVNFQTQLEHRWHRFRNMAGDDSARGSSYESAFQKLLNEYFGGRFDIRENCSVLDRELNCFNEFGKNAQNEVDIVALFSHATPRLVLQEGDMKWMPLEGSSFLCEVKSQVDKGKLEADLKKLEILRRLERDPDDRFGTAVRGDFCVNHHLHCLVYDRASISDETMNSILEQNDAWDLVLLVEDDVLIVNDTMPANEYLIKNVLFSRVINDTDDAAQSQVPNENGCISVDHGLAWYLMILAISIPVPLGKQTSDTFSTLLRQSVLGIQPGATTEIK